MRDQLDRARRRFELPPGAFDRFERRRGRRVAMQRVAAGAIATVIAAVGTWLAWSAFRAGEGQRPAARVTLVVDLPGRPGAVVVAFRSVWIADAQKEAVSRIDPRDGSVQDEIALPRSLGPPVALFASRDRVWVQTAALATRPAGPPALVGIDPRTNDVDIRHSLGANEHAEVAIASGSVWSANRETGEVTRRDADTGRILARLEGRRGGLMVVAGAGSVWVLSKGPHDSDPRTSGTVARIDPLRDEVAATVAVGELGTAIAAGRSGVWVADAPSGTVSRIDPTTNEVVATIPVPAAPTAVAVAGDAIVVGSPNGRLSIIDAATNSVISTVGVGPDLGDVAAGGGVAWATSPGGGALVRLET